MSAKDRCILVVDADPTVGRHLREGMENKFDVLVAENRTRALEILKEKVVDVLVTDDLIAEQDRENFFDFLRNNDAFVPVIVIFGAKPSHGHIKPWENGIVLYVERTLDTKALLMVLQNLVHYIVDGRKSLEDSKKQISLILSHELRTPLFAVYTGLLILEDILADKVPQDVLNIFSSIKRGSRRLEKLVNNLTLYNQVTLGLAQAVYEKYCDVTNFGLLLTQALRGLYEDIMELKPMLFFKGGAFGINFKCSQNQVVAGLARIIENSLKFAKTDCMIRFESYIQNERVYLIIKDNGPGFPEGFSHDSLDFFFQPNRLLSEQQGVGLGLSLAQYLINLNKGDICFFNKQGAVVKISFPVIRD